VKAYVQGLAWVLQYYHEGCPSWTWFYPYLYAPLASDVTSLGELNLSFSIGKPFTPLQQLISVLPPQSRSLLPKSYSSLMTSSTSALAKYFPTSYTEDMNGKRRAWESVVNIPFINETVLLSELSHMERVEGPLSEEERLRNAMGQEAVFEAPIKK
jgi:5'-3' exonuclease